MADLVDIQNEGDSSSAGNETLVEIERRHKAEVRKLEGEVRALLKTAKKSTKAQIETQVLRMQYDLKGKHQEELDEYESRPVTESGTSTDPVALSLPEVADTNEAGKSEEDIVAAKKAKAKKKQDKKKTKDQDLANAKQQIQEENSGPSARDIELAKINAKLSPEAVTVKAIISDGNCLYRAIADQLQFTGSALTADHNDLRGIAAAYIRSHAEDFSPFIGVEAQDPEFDSYCDKVASLTDAEWGGQLEIKALSAALELPILIYAADGPVITMNDTESFSTRPLRITYHKNYYTLGEHYNSVETVSRA